MKKRLYKDTKYFIGLVVILMVAMFISDISITGQPMFSFKTSGCKTNAECGTSGYIGTPYCIGNNVFQSYKSALCVKGVFRNSCKVFTSNMIKSTCPSNMKCSNGQCIISSPFKSKYFQDDNILLDVLQGTVSTYKFSDLYSGVTYLIDKDTDKFQYKILSALRMLGYSLQGTQLEPRYLMRWAEAFQKKYNLPVSDTITSDFIKKLDEEIYKYEAKIKPYVDLSPIDENFIGFNDRPVTYVPHHKNEPPKDHVRFFYTYLMSVLPSKLAPLTKENFMNFYAGQAHGVIYEDNGLKLNYIPSAMPLNKQGQGIYKTNRVVPFDVQAASAFMHEYGHHVDFRFIQDKSTEFQSMFFDLNDCLQGAYGKYCKIKAEAKFVSQYADGWNHLENSNYHSIVEAFAESFALYVTNGKLYRKLATIDEQYNLQYNWLKENVFERVEYCTGDENLIKNTSPLWDYTTNNLPSGTSDFTEELIRRKVSDDNPIFSLFNFIIKC